MPHRALSFLRAVDRFSGWCGKLFAWIVIPLMGVLVYEVVSRYFFSAPTLWAFDITYMLYGSHFMLLAGYTLSKQGHIRTDFVYRLLPPRWQGRIDATLYLVFFLPAMGVMLWISTEFAYDSWVQREASFLSPWLPPIYPLKTALPVSVALLLVQGLAELVKSLYAARFDRWPP